MNLSSGKQKYSVDTSSISGAYKKFTSGRGVKVKTGQVNGKLKSWEYQILYK
jgi:hypothetical protein